MWPHATAWASRVFLSWILLNQHYGANANWAAVPFAGYCGLQVIVRLNECDSIVMCKLEDAKLLCACPQVVRLRHGVMQLRVLRCKVQIWLERNWPCTNKVKEGGAKGCGMFTDC